MKKVLVGLALLIGSVAAYAHISSAQRFELNKHMGHVAFKHKLGNLVNNASTLVKAQYDYSLSGGAVGDIPLLDEDGLQVSLPINAVITRAWLDVVTQPSSASPTLSTVAVKVQSAADIYAATSSSALSTGRKDGVPQDTAATSLKLTAERSVAVTVAGQALTAGKINVFIEYMLSDS